MSSRSDTMNSSKSEDIKMRNLERQASGSSTGSGKNQYPEQTEVTEPAELTDDILKTFMSQMNDENYIHWKRLEQLKISDTFIAEVLGVHHHHRDQYGECVFVESVFDDTARKIYCEAYVRLVYQYFHEFETDEEIPQHIFEEQENLSYDDVRGITCDYKLRVLQAVMAFCDKFGTDWPADDHQVVDYFQLALMLKRKHLAEFQVCFEKFLKKSSQALGEYYKVALKHEVRLLFIIATRRKFYKTRNFIFQKFPYIDVNSTILRSFYETQDFTFVIVAEFKSNTLSSIENSLNDTVPVRETVGNGTSVNNQTSNSALAPLNPEIVAPQSESEILIKSNFQKIEKLLEAYSKENLNEGFWRKFVVAVECFLKKSLKENEASQLKQLIFGRHITSPNTNVSRMIIDFISAQIVNDREMDRSTDGQKTSDRRHTWEERQLSKLNEIVLKNALNAEEAKSISIFERILSTPRSSPLIKLIWDKFDLSKKPEILSLKNHYGKYLMHYVIESGDDENLLTFLSPEPSNDPKFKKKTHYLKFMNIQYQKITGTTFYERYLTVCENDMNRELKLEKKFFNLIFSLLEEIGCIDDIKNDVPIDKLISMAPVNGDTEDSFKRKYIVEDLLGNIVAHWTKKDRNYEEYKKKLWKLSPFFRMVCAILQDDFIADFHKSLSELEAFYRDRDRFVSTITNFMFILLLTATLNNKRKIIDHLLNYDGFSTVVIRFPLNMRTSETCHYVALKLLESGHELGKNQIPTSWLPPKVFEEFLDSRLSYHNEELIEIDCSYLLHENTKQCKINSKKDVDDTLIFWEDTRTLKYIKEQQHLNQLITHPAVSTYIDLKTIKYQRIFRWNFVAFLLFVIALVALIITHLYDFKAWMIVSQVSFFLLTYLYLFPRELLQCYLIGSFWKYLKRLSNLFEFLLIISSSITLIAYIFTPTHIIFVSVSSVLTLTLATAVLLSMLPFPPMPLYMMMLRKVGITFAKVFFFFIAILVSFTIAFCVFFRGPIKNGNSNATSNANDTIDRMTTEGSLETSTEADESGPLYNENFYNIHHSFMKVIMMLSGEFTIEPSTLSCIQFIFFLFFVLSTFILFNLILGLAIDDVQKLKEEARYLTLKQNAQKFIEASELFLKVLRKKVVLEETPEKPESPSDQSVYQRILSSRFFRFLQINFHKFIFWLYKFLINHQPFLHKIDKIYVDTKSKAITLEINQSSLEVGGELNEETFDNICQIIDKENKIGDSIKCTCNKEKSDNFNKFMLE